MPNIGSNQAVRHRGVYAAGTSYVVNDVVQYNGSAFMATASTLGNTPAVPSSYWTQLASTGVALPASGLLNQKLVKNSSADFDMSWQDVTVASAAVSETQYMLPVSPTSGTWYDTRYSGNANSAVSALAVNVCQYYPVVLGTAATITGLGIFTGSSTIATVYLGISAADGANGYPGTLLSLTSVACSANATAYTSTFAGVAVPSTLFYLSVGSGATISLSATPSAAPFPRGVNGNSIISSAAVPTSYASTTADLGRAVNNPTINTGAAPVGQIVIWFRLG